MVSLSQTSLVFFLAISAVSTGNSDAAGNLRYESRKLAQAYTLASQYVYSMLEQVNKERAYAGLSALCMSTKLVAASTRQSKDMAAKNFLSHTGSDGSTMSTRVTATGFKWNALAENVAAGQKDVDAVMKSWMNSSGHRANILGDYTMFGTAYAYNDGSTYKHYWTQNFGKGSTEKCDYEDAEVSTTEAPVAIGDAMAINSTGGLNTIDPDTSLLTIDSTDTEGSNTPDSDTTVLTVGSVSNMTDPVLATTTKPDCKAAV